MMSEYEISSDIEFSTNRLAQIAFDVLRVDAEPKRSRVVKELSVTDNKLHINAKSKDLRNLRVSINSTLDHLLLITETFEAFGPPTSEKYDHYNA